MGPSPSATPGTPRSPYGTHTSTFMGGLPWAHHTDNQAKSRQAGSQSSWERKSHQDPRPSQRSGCAGPWAEGVAQTEVSQACAHHASPKSASVHTVIRFPVTMPTAATLLLPATPSHRSSCDNWSPAPSSFGLFSMWQPEGIQ